MKIILIVLILLDSYVATAEQSIPPLYGPPYYNASYYSYGGLIGQTVSESIEIWWPAYQDCWGIYTCDYTVNLLEDGIHTGIFAKIPVSNGCGGTETILGTAYCDNGFSLINNRCNSDIPLNNNLGEPVQNCSY